jgi:hypothetical protein
MMLVVLPIGVKHPARDTKRMPDYTKAKIYSIVSDVDKEVYVGSTCSELTERFSRHKSCSKTHQTRRVYAHIAATGGWDNWRIVLVEAVPCKNCDELHEHESRHIKRIGTLNTIMPPDCGWRRALYEKIDESRLASAAAPAPPVEAAAALATRDVNPEDMSDPVYQAMLTQLWAMRKKSRAAYAEKKAARSAPAPEPVHSEPDPEPEPEQMNHSCEICIVVPSCENPEKQAAMNRIGQDLSKIVMKLGVRKDPTLNQFVLKEIKFIVKELELRAARRDIAKTKAYDMHMY